jgi:hypothetical protein
VSINNFRQKEVTAQKTLQVKMAGERGTVNAIMDIVKHYWGAYGMGVEYAYTLAHRSAAFVYPEYVIFAAVVARK